MKKKFVVLSADDLRARMRKSPMPKLSQPEDHEIDFSDIPELTDDELKQFRRVKRPLIEGIAINLEPKSKPKKGSA